MSKLIMISVGLSVVCAALNGFSGNWSAMLGWANATLLGGQLLLNQRQQPERE